MTTRTSKAVYRPAPNGDRTIYVEHGIWLNPDTGRIHVTIGGNGGHWSYLPGHKRYAAYQALLQDAGRWPAVNTRKETNANTNH